MTQTIKIVKLEDQHCNKDSNEMNDDQNDDDENTIQHKMQVSLSRGEGFTKCYNILQGFSLAL